MIDVHPETMLKYGDVLPPVYRYMGIEHIDRFFEDGSLRLTTYERCKALEDAARRDIGEGKQHYAITDGQQMLAGVQGVGNRSYLFCTSLSPRITHFTDKTCLKIIDAIKFAEAVGAKLSAGAIQLGACVYRPDREPMYGTTAPLFPVVDPSSIGDPEAFMKAMNHHLAKLVDDRVGSDTYFAKPAIFACDGEFRFVFTVAAHVSGPIDIKCPEALAVCARNP
jgi:hypothetical protein